MILVVLSLNYLLILLFLKSYYAVYFLVLFLAVYLKYIVKQKRNIYIKYIYIMAILVSTYLFEYFDNDIYDIYLLLDLNEIYTSIGGDITYILALLHSFILFGL